MKNWINKFRALFTKEEIEKKIEQVELPPERPTPEVYKKYTPRYDLYDAPGVPSISPNHQPTQEKIETTAFHFLPISKERVEAISTIAVSSYLDDVLPTVSSGSCYSISEGVEVGLTISDVFGEENDC